jgi:RNA polymerase sigma-70 factor (ECF subfamily)
MVGDYDCENKNDEELAGLSLSDPDYFYCLAKRFETRLVGYIIRISRMSSEDAEDILQEVFIKAYLNLNDFDSRLKFSSWIYRIAHNQTISELRKRNIRPTVYIEEGGFEHLASEFDLHLDIDQQFKRQKINEILATMDEKYKEVLVLRFLEEKDYTEIADILKKPISTVGNLISRGKKLFIIEYQKLNKKYATQ